LRDEENDSDIVRNYNALEYVYKAWLSLMYLCFALIKRL